MPFDNVMVYVGCTCSSWLAICRSPYRDIRFYSLYQALAGYLDRDVNGEPADHAIRVCVGDNACRVCQ